MPKARDRESATLGQNPNRPQASDYSGSTSKVTTRAPESQGREASSSTSIVANPPTHEEIAIAAYEIYLRRGGSDGGHVDDWLEAEKELRAKPGDLSRKSRATGA